MSAEPIIAFKRLHPDRDQDIPLPCYMTPYSAGMDLYAAIQNSLTLTPGRITLIPTGFAMALPQGFEAQIRPRSGLAAKYGIGIINSPGTIDADYRGEVKIALINMSNQSYTLKRGERIAQMVIQRVFQARLHVVESLDETERMDGGFGSTGMS